MAGKTILIIEDDRLHREMLTTALAEQGFTVAPATEGNEALNRLSSRPIPDLILLDMLVPSGNFDGWWFLHQRQRIPALAAILVVIMTALIVASEAWAARWSISTPPLPRVRATTTRWCTPPMPPSRPPAGRRTSRWS